MKKHIIVYCLLCLIPFLINFAFAEEEIIIESLFFKGLRQEIKSGPQVIISSSDEKGNVSKVRVLKGTHPDLDRAAQDAIRHWKFEPVLKDGKPISFTFAVAVDFKLREAVNVQNSESDSINHKDLETILRKCAEYCERLHNSALFFVCQEKIKEVIFQSPERIMGTSVMVSSSGGRRVYRVSPASSRLRSVVNNYIYDYQLVKKGDKIKESRILLEENGEEKNEKNARLKTKRFYSERSAFGPIGLLSRDWQDMYSYKIIKEKTIDGRKAFVIEAKPKKKIERKPNYGKIWVDKEDFSIIKIEIEQVSLAGIEKIEKASKKGGVRPIITVTHDYGIKKDGIRFPSKTTFKEDLKAAHLGRIKKSRLFITYDKYRFFTVETEVKY